ncbi:MAG: M20/M25/M40 family metallo-hydrolase [Gemmatimonadetes bacterium]|nr:M20/M25/M40 family metallo-hydrolase [Gemmatimonadota bacterium]
MSLRSLVMLALVAAPLAAQPARPAPANRDRFADPIPAAEYPAYVRRNAANDPTILRLVDEGMNRSQAMTLAQVLMDRHGQRLTGSPQSDAAQAWMVETYASWGVGARRERYGTWLGWSKGVAHVDLIAPRVRSLEATALAWSPSTGGRPIEGDVIAYPANISTPEAFDAWLPNVKGRIFLMNVPRLSCRSPQQWQEFGTPEELERVNKAQQELQLSWNNLNVAMSGGRSVWQKLRDAGAIAVFTFQWSNYPGINKVFGSPNQTVPSFAVGCEDYGLLYRMSRAGQAPRVRAFTDSELLGERPVFNVIAELKGTERPNEYVVLSAHFDSWAASSGSTDNGTGTITMMEALRILRQVYPNPKRTIIVGHWNGEEQGLNGSRAFSEDHPEVVAGLQALFNQDNGTGRIVNLSGGPSLGAGDRLAGYLGAIPNEFTRYIRFQPVSGQATGGSDNASFACYKAPAYGTGALGWDYGSTTWHTDRDSYDKVVEADLKHNATLLAMLAFLASEDPTFQPHQVVDPLPAGPNGQPGVWRECVKAQRQVPAATR